MIYPKFCYVIAELPGGDKYSNLAIISSAALRRVHPNADIVWLSTKPMNSFSDVTRSAIRKLNIQLHVIWTPFKNVAMASRDLKTRMRQIIDGDFMFIDADALPIRSLARPFSTGADIAIALDGVKANRVGMPAPWVVEEVYSRIGWRHHPAGYFNTGVILWRDTPKSRELGQTWHDLWLQQTAKTAIPYDQPSFNAATEIVRPDIDVLAREYNAIVGVNPRWAVNSRVMHFCCSNDDGRPDKNSVLHQLLTHWETDGAFDEVTYASCAGSRNPYARSPDSVRLRFAIGDYAGAVARLVQLLRERIRN